jgi:exosortase/archaeosortase family protein
VSLALAKEREEESLLENAVYRRILIFAAILFLTLPSVITFNEFLTKVVESVRLYVIIQNLLVSHLVRILGVILQSLFKVKVAVSKKTLFLHDGGRSIHLIINWNCVGWQSLVLFLLTLISGLQGPYTHRSRFECLIIGLEGIFLLNLIRITLVCLAALYWGYLPALILHDYGGTIMTLLYLAVFWHLAFNYLLKKRASKRLLKRCWNRTIRRPLSRERRRRRNLRRKRGLRRWVGASSSPPSPDGVRLEASSSEARATLGMV